MDDKILKKLIEDELDWEPSVDAAGIGVSVEKGAVKLNGHVRNYAEMMAAERAVKRVKGVRGYVSSLEVRPEPIAGSDMAIAERVSNILGWDVTLPKGAIKARVQAGFVTLTGEVEWAYQKTGAERGLRNVLGVRGVINSITIKPRVAAKDIKHRIEAALERRADTTAQHVVVSVDGGKVVLDGASPTWAERETIEHACWSAPGVTAVEDRMTIEP
jgi:osmotically-inducible protein OsmY